jgi:hypothetical protein
MYRAAKSHPQLKQKEAQSGGCLTGLLSMSYLVHGRLCRKRKLFDQTTTDNTSSRKHTRPKQSNAARFRGYTDLLDGVGETAEASRGDVFVYP